MPSIVRFVCAGIDGEAGAEAPGTACSDMPSIVRFVCAGIDGEAGGGSAPTATKGPGGGAGEPSTGMPSIVRWVEAPRAGGETAAAAAGPSAATDATGAGGAGAAGKPTAGRPSIVRFGETAPDEAGEAGPPGVEVAAPEAAVVEAGAAAPGAAVAGAAVFQEPGGEAAAASRGALPSPGTAASDTAGSPNIVRAAVPGRIPGGATGPGPGDATAPCAWGGAVEGGATGMAGAGASTRTATGVPQTPQKRLSGVSVAPHVVHEDIARHPSSPAARHAPPLPRRAAEAVRGKARLQISIPSAFSTV
jgi:hypothetical protein